MSLTAQLGTSNSGLGNIQLGFGSIFTGNVFTGVFSDSLLFVEDISGFNNSLVLSSYDELDPEIFIILSGDERGADGRLRLSGSY